MPRARPAIGIAGLARNAEVPHFGVQLSMHQLSVDHGAAADPGADRQVDKVRLALSRAPFGFAQRRSVDVGVEADGNA
jgi:hypothetical protein